MILAAGALEFFGVVAMLVLHVVAPNRLPVVDLVVADPLLGWRHGADLDFLFYDEGALARVRTDADGFRVGESPVDHEAPVLAVLGDSFSFAAQVDWAESWPVRAAAAAEETCGLRLSPRNYGVAGYGTLQQTLLFEREVAETRPEFVVVAMFGNDIADSVGPPAGPSPPALYGVTRPWAAWEENRLTVQPAGTAEAFRVPWPIREVVGAFRGPADALVRWARPSRDVQPPARPEAPKDGMAPLGTVMGPAGWDVTSALLGRLFDKIRAAGARPALMYIEHPMAVERGAHHAFVDGSLPGAVAAERGVPFLDLGPWFRTARSAGGRPLHNLDGAGHWNADGHALAGRLAGEMLCRRFADQNPVPSPR